MKKLYRSRYDRKISGVCGGLGQYFKLDSSIFRLVCVFLFLFTAVLPMIILYLLTAIFIPLEPNHTPALEIKRFYRSKDRVIAGICSGLAKIFNIDPIPFRLLLIVACLVTGIFPVVVAYLVGWIIIPQEAS
jgi:phage shock protein C